MKNGNWYFTVHSREYGDEEYGPYGGKAKALNGIQRIKRKARKLNDSIQREYSEPYRK